MNRRKSIAHLLGWGLCAAVVLPFAHAIERGTADSGPAYVSGGIGESEQAALSEEKGRYSFWLTTATKGSGAYLASVEVRILNARTRQSVLEHTMDGPWLFVALPAGRYEVEASLRESAGQPAQTLKKTLTIRAGALRHTFLYFNTSDEVGREK